MSTGSGSTGEDSTNILNELDSREVDVTDGLVNPPDDQSEADNSTFLEETVDGVDNQMSISMTTDGEYTNMEIGDVKDDCTVSPSSSADTLSEAKHSPQCKRSLRKGVSEDCLSGAGLDDGLPEVDISAAIQPAQCVPGTATQIILREGDIGHITDNDIPLVHLVRLLASKFLLTGYQQGLIPDRHVRLSVKSLALGCIGSALQLYPKAFLKTLHKSSQLPDLLQDIQDILLYTSHSDPQLKGNVAVLIGHVIHSALIESRGNLNKWIEQEGAEGKTLICCQL